MHKLINHIKRKDFEEIRSGFSTIIYLNNEISIEPFLIFNEFQIDRPIFGSHPYAGVSVLTYIHPDSKGKFINKDSLGNHNTIEAGGLQLTQAGEGILQEELPKTFGEECHGFNIWVNLSAKDKMVAPQVFNAFAKAIPEANSLGIKVRVLQGNYKGKESIVELLTPIQLYDIYLEPQNEIELKGEELTFIYVVSGSGNILGKTIKAKSLVLFDEDGETVKIKTNSQPINFLFASGKPHYEPIVYGGPFVMNSQAQIQAAKKRYSLGEMGSINSKPKI